LTVRRVITANEVPYTRGLHEIGDGCWAWIQPDGQSDNNAGIIVGQGASVVVDTTYELRGTRDMLDAASGILGDNPIRYAVNTHEDSDHIWGNQLLPPDAQIFASSGTVASFFKFTPEKVRSITSTEHGAGTQWVWDNYVNRDVDLIEPRLPDVAIDTETELEVGGRIVRLVPVFPAHSNGDVIVHVPDAGIVFSGDLVFNEVGPAMNAGPLSRWLSALDVIVGMSPVLVVPGHGPVTDVEGVLRFKWFLETVRDAAQQGLERGLSPVEVVALLPWDSFAHMFAGERVIDLIDAIYREIDPGHRRMTLAETGAVCEELRSRIGRGASQTPSSEAP
jgi:glyoxylase-like metal-dependent hydrolase (beta-lactamase superfamily II)